MRQAVSNACYEHYYDAERNGIYGDCSDCGLFAPDGQPCACGCHRTNGDTERYNYWAQPAETPAEQVEEPDAEEQLERRRLDYADNMAISNMGPTDRAYLENWPRSRDDYAGYDDYADDMPSEKQLINWREANEYVNEGEEPDYPEEGTTDEQE